MSWEKKTLENVCISISDGDHQAPPKTDCGIPFVTISNINNTNRFDFSDVMYVSEEYYERLDIKRKPQKNDILYSVVGSFGIPVFMNENLKFVFQRHIAILRPNEEEIVPIFLYYIMKSHDFYMQADSVALGAAQRTISLTSLRNMEVCVPEIKVQRKIADILSSYDNLIENNQKQIKLLEEAAKRLYKEWFVDLRFPGHENVKIVDGVPEGWKKVLVGEVIGKVPRTEQIKKVDYLKSGIIPVIDQSREFIAGYTNNHKSIVDIGCPVIVFGDHTRIIKYIQFPFAKGADGTQLIVSNEKTMPQSLLYLTLVAVDLSNYHYARHFKYLKAECILMPIENIANKFDKLVSPILLQIQKLMNTNINLQEARDRLLPKLMSGEIEV